MFGWIFQSYHINTANMNHQLKTQNVEPIRAGNIPK